ncbi:MAG: RagB/SusD family nutrient uptake outer membrane protein [Bacteroidota bacterium]
MKTIKICLMLIGITMFSCSDDFLENEPVAGYFQENFYQTKEQVFEGLVAAYDPLQWSFYGGNWVNIVMMGEIRSDNANAGGGSATDQAGWQALDDFTNTPNTGESLNYWARNFAGIYRCNLIINLNKPELDIAAYQAEAKFLRAWYYFDLFRTYGPVPIVETTAFPEGYSPKRASLDETLDYIVKDLEAAAQALPEVDGYDASFKGRATRGAANALLGKVYLYWADWNNDDKAKFDKAAEYLKKVVTSGKYALYADYKQLFSPAAENSSESIFEIQHSNLSKVGGEGWGNGALIDGNLAIQLCGIRGLQNNSLYVEGWGFCLPTKNLFDTFEPEDTIRRAAAIITEAELTAAGSTFAKAEGYNSEDYTGMWQKKYANLAAYVAIGGDANLNKSGNVRVIRYADVLLMLAEALHRGNGTQAEALAYINLVRRRGIDHDKDGVFRTAEQLMASKGWGLLQVIWYERRIEFALEGDRWFDLVRSGRANATMFGSQFDDTDVYLPIHQQETQISNGSLTTFPAN